MAFGARFLKRVIDERIKLPISAQWKDGSHFEITVKDGQVTVTPSPIGVISADDALAYGDLV